MEGYGPDNEYSQSQVGQEWFQNSEWMTRFHVPNFSENSQLQFAHGSNMFTSGQSAFQGFPTPLYRRLPYSEDREIESIGQKTRNFIRSPNFRSKTRKSCSKESSSCSIEEGKNNSSKKES